MRKVNILIFFVAFIVFLFTFLFDSFNLPTDIMNNNKSNEAPPKNLPLDNQESRFKVPKTGIHELMGVSDTEVEKNLGKPERIDPTQYGYSWWIYGRNTEKYLQIGIQDHKVVTMYALGNKLQTAPFKIGINSDEIYKQMNMSDTISLNYNNSKVEFELSEDELMVSPLVTFDNQYIQLYFDHFTDKLDGVRYMNAATLIKLRPYTLVYQGEIPQPREPSDQEWVKIQQAEEQEIFDITNIMRMRHKLNSLEWHGKTAEVAFGHSKDMEQENYFAHDSPTAGTLGDRLETDHIAYNVAGENIAAKYTDGVAAVVGWMNSEGHRKNILNKIYTHLGVGVYRDYYTQDFLTPLQ